MRSEEEQPTLARNIVCGSFRNNLTCPAFTPNPPQCTSAGVIMSQGCVYRPNPSLLHHASTSADITSTGPVHRPSLSESDHAVLLRSTNLVSPPPTSTALASFHAMNSRILPPTVPIHTPHFLGVFSRSLPRITRPSLHPDTVFPAIVASCCIWLVAARIDSPSGRSGDGFLASRSRFDLSRLASGGPLSSGSCPVRCSAQGGKLPATLMAVYRQPQDKRRRQSYVPHLNTVPEKMRTCMYSARSPPSPSH